MAHRTRTKINNRLLRWVMIMAIGVCLGACAPEHSSYSRFEAIQGQVWHKDLAVRFTPQWADSSSTYNLLLTVRHTQEYPYANLPVLVDLIGNDGTVTRYQAQFTVTDGHGNWQGQGFGTLFQCQLPVIRHLAPHQASRVVVWLNLRDTDSIPGITDLGITLTPD